MDHIMDIDYEHFQKEFHFLLIYQCLGLLLEDDHRNLSHNLNHLQL